MSATNVEIARHGYEALVRGDLDAVRDLLDPDVRWHAGDPTAEGTCQNREQAIEFMARARFRQAIGEPVELIDAGEKIVVIMRRAGETGESELVANLTTFRDGKVVEMVHYPNPDDARAAAGV